MSIRIGPEAVRPGDAVLLSGDIGRHGMAIMAVREGLAFETEIASDCAPLAAPVLKLLESGVAVHCLRDLTRGGLAAALVEIAQTAGLHIQLDETAIPVRPEVQSACELLGLDPLYVANEGRFVAFVPEAEAKRALSLLQTEPVSAGARRIGQVTADGPAGLVDAPHGHRHHTRARPPQRRTTAPDLLRGHICTNTQFHPISLQKGFAVVSLEKEARHLDTDRFRSCDDCC